MVKNNLDLIFLGSSGGIQVPSFHCSCRTCEDARKDPTLQRTRASVVLLGQENILIDAGPDIEFQLEREKIKFVDRIFLTHWHYDHCFGLGAFPELGSHGTWKKRVIDLYLPEQDTKYFENIGFSWAKYRYDLHPIKPGDVIKLPDILVEVVRTTHSVDSVGYIVTSPNKIFAYLVDGVIPPEKTIDRLKEFNLDFIVLEGTVDDLLLPEGVSWVNFTITEAVDFWRTLDVPKCILTHASFHSWIFNELTAGITPSERKTFEKINPGLSFAYDGLKIDL
ncbi:MAG: MBL fold metallo-hydrolase [Promethearchaeota archaeon]|jgi:phosphoribosyl 1,2-cyclic phosphodiesterase